MQNLKLIQLTILNIINTRWLPMSNVVHNLHQVIFSVIDALNDDVNNVENSKDRDRASQLVSNLDPEFIISTMFLADLMYILSKMIKIFQRYRSFRIETFFRNNDFSYQSAIYWN